MIRLLAVLAAVVLLVFPAFWLFGMTVPVPKFRAGDYTDFLFFTGALAVVYGGVALGVAVEWARARAAGRAVRMLGIFKAGVWGAGAVSVAVILGYGVHGLIALGAFERGVGNLWGLIVIFALLFGALVAGGLALLWFVLSRPPSGGPRFGSRSGPPGPPHLPTATAG